MIVNEDINNYPQVVQIYIKESGELVYESKLIPVGTKIDTGKLLVDLDKGEYPLTIEIKNGKACVISAACPDRICMHTPAISKSGESIVCLPARVSVQIQGERGDGLDEIVG